MRGLAKLQLIGPLALFAAVAAAEGAVYALAHSPSSATLWYINIHLFGGFQRSHYLLSNYVGIGYFQFLFIGLPLLCLALAGVFARRQILLATASNLGFVYASFLVYSWHNVVSAPRAASLGAVGVSSGPDFYMFAILLGASLMSFVISHVVYLGAVRARA
jgi:hypothetical protein